MDSLEWNETHKAPCTPRQRLYQTKINERQHSLCAPKLQGQIQYLGGLWESLIGLGCVCVRLASFNQVSQQQTLGVKWCVSGSEAFQSGQKVGEAVGLRAQPSHSVNVSQFSSGAQKAFALPAVKLVDREPLKSPTTVSLHKTAAFTLKELTRLYHSPYQTVVGTENNFAFFYWEWEYSSVACIHYVAYILLCFHNSEWMDGVTVSHQINVDNNGSTHIISTTVIGFYTEGVVIHIWEKGCYC